VRVAGENIVITETQLHSLLSDGYLVLPNSVSASTTNQLLIALADLPPAHAHRNLLHHSTIQQFATSSEAIALIAPVLGKGAFPVRGILFDKLPGANWKVAWHQDLSIAVKEKHDIAAYGPWSVKESVPHVQPPASVLENMLTLRLYLDDCFEDNGPVRVLPGSHAHGILSTAEIQRFRSELPEVSTTTPAGGVLLMRPLLLHASSPATNPNHRRVVHIEYAAAPLSLPLQWHAA
jgi:ectoine hydroxylase-related dioxygenase (phytanoyl-CoA dioxygenase family)